jgi:hypothetical protein|tara:strand:+ start:862 stop:1218 length:357 start_codon:yes stop_codon:yes gene_type:complete
MTSPQYVSEIGSVYTQMYNPPVCETVLEEKSKDQSNDHDYDIPKWARILHKHKQEEARKRPPHAAHVEPREDANEEEENEESDSKYSLVIKLVQEILGEEEHSEVAANTVYIIRDLVK